MNIKEFESNYNFYLELFLKREIDRGEFGGLIWSNLIKFLKKQNELIEDLEKQLLQGSTS